MDRSKTVTVDPDAIARLIRNFGDAMFDYATDDASYQTVVAARKKVEAAMRKIVGPDFRLGS